ncbi:MAG: threonine--tRNA ligase [Firmicutes bacterium]|nr:threonine--tRNA ligase [Bacillota bacterium]
MSKELNHSAAHLLGMAVKNIFPTAKLGNGIGDEDSFYYDVDFATPIKNEDLQKLEGEMKRLIKSNLPIICRVEKTKTEAKKLFEKSGEIYKTDLIPDMTIDDKVMFVKIGDFLDLCVGGHVNYTTKIKAFKLTKIAGAYWRGDAENKMLTRIYGVAFSNKAELDEYEAKQEEIRRRDHNRIGRELDLFTTVDIVGQGLPHMMPKGSKILQVLQRFVEDEEERRGYQHVKTPLIAKKELYELSGHWQMYKDGMFVIGNELFDEEVFALSPMTCPFHFFIYKNSIRSYRDLPIRYGETRLLFRNENSGEMHGLTRMRQFTLSEGHIIARYDQIQQVIDECLDLTNFLMKKIGIQDKVSYRLSKWDPKNKKKYMGKASTWEQSQDELRKVLQRHELQFVEADGDAAFYGPKIDIQATNVHGKEDTIITIQLDFALAERYDMTYIDENGDKQRPVIIHRSSIGCYERTLAMLIEHYAGAFPVWLAPTQAVIMGISNKQDDYVEDVYKKLMYSGIRIERDIRAEKVGKKIREHTLSKVPYLIIVGEQEVEKGNISVRTREGEDKGSMSIEEFIRLIKDN